MGSDENAVAEIIDLLARPRSSAYRLAKAIWELKQIEDGALFDNLWRSERIGRRRAYYLARIGEAFEGLSVSEADMERVGWTKLALIATGVTQENVSERLDKALNPDMTVKALRSALAGKQITSGRRRLVISLSEGQHARAVAALKTYGAVNKDGRLQGTAAALMALLDHLKQSTSV